MQGTVSLRSVHGKYLSAQPDGRAEWNRDHASTWEYFQVEQRHNGKITLKGAHGKYVSAQHDGSVQINRDAAPPGGWEEFTVEDRGNNVVCLKSCHGKYLSAQQNGTAQWNREHAPRGGWEELQIEPSGGTGQRESAMTTAPMPSYVIVAQAGSPEVNGNYEFMPGKHENRHFSTIAGHYQHTQNPEIFIAFQDCGKAHQRPEWNKWMIISKIGVLYAAHTGGKIGVPPREGVWENVEAWGHPGAPGGKHPAPTVYHPPDATTQTQQHPNTDRSSTFASGESIQVLEAVSGKPVRFKLNNPPNHNDAWVGIYPTGAPDQDHGGQNQRWKYIRDIDVNNVSLSNGAWAEGDWSIRVFSDGGYTLAERKDFTIQSEHKIHSTESISAEEKFEFVPVSEYDEVWNDSGSGANQDVSVWRPRVPAGCHLIGMTAKNGHSRPTFPTLVIRAGGRDIAPPERFDLVWWQERGRRRFWCWRPIPPAGYVSLGDVGTTSETPPSHKDVVCVALACLSPSRQPLGGQIWNDRGGGAPKDAAFFAQPGGTGLFRCSDDATHNKPHGEFPIPAAASTSHHTTQTVAPQPLDETAEKPGRGRIGLVALFGLFLLIPGLPLLIIGTGSTGEDRLGMIIPGAILTGVGGFLAVGAWFALISSWLKSGKTAPRWTKFAAVFAVLLLGPGVTLLVIGSISAESFVAQSESNTTLEIFDVDDMGDQGFIIFIEAVLGDFDNNGIYDHCENIIVSATHSGSWMSDPWTGYQKVNPPDESRQVFELGECESGDHVQQKHKDGRNIIKMGQACYGCMKGTTTISAEYSDGSKAAVMWIQDGEEVIGAIGMIIGGSIMTGVSSIALISLLMIWGGSRHRKQDGSQKSSIDILEATTNKGVYFRINNPPTSNDAWVGIYPRGGEDSDHGEEGVRWHWLRDIDVNKARFYEKSKGRWSIRVFSDNGFTLDSQDDFEIVPKDDQWWKD